MPYPDHILALLAEASASIIEQSMETETYIDFLFDLQNLVIQSDYLDGYDDQVKRDASLRFLTLKEFFNDLLQVKKRIAEEPRISGRPVVDQKDVMEKATTEIIRETSPAEWIKFLFELQNAAIGNGEVLTFSEAGASEFATRFSALKTFFASLSEV